MASLVVRSRARLFHGHCWVYGTEVAHVHGEPAPGDVVRLIDQRNRPLGSAIFNPQSQIVARRFSFRRQDLDADFFVRRITRAWQYRQQLASSAAPNAAGIDPRLCRVVWSESDGLPGLIVDRYDDALVVQTLTRAMDDRKPLITAALNEVLAPRVIVERNDSPIRKAEGMDPAVTGILSGEGATVIEWPAPPVTLRIDLLDGQKTGLYLDQLTNHRAVAALAPGARVLDAFCHQGGFALACAAAGAASVDAIDSSQPAVDAGSAAAGDAGLDIRWHVRNAFDALKEFEKRGDQFDLIVLDPPSFTKGKGSLQSALRGYKELHLRALKMLAAGGRLATFSCSHHVGWQELRDIAAAAAVDARRSVRLRQTLGQRADHPIDLAIPETEYLRGLVLEVTASW